MSSGIICKLKLSKFLQEFLRGFYLNYDPVFKFPREDADELHIASKFANLLRPAPINYKPVDYGPETFLIEVPYSQERDAFYYNYLSDNRQEKLTEKIHQAYRVDFHDKLDAYRNDGWDTKASIIFYMEDMNLSQEHFDKLIKDYSRWKNHRRNRKFRQKSQLQNRANCPPVYPTLTHAHAL